MYTPDSMNQLGHYTKRADIATDGIFYNVQPENTLQLKIGS